MLTLCVIARDEEDRIARCLGSAPTDAERLVVVDEATTDRTAEVARREGARVVLAPWPGHVAQKNRALSLATTPWALSLDADEWLEAPAREAIARALARPGDAAGFSFPRCSRWLGRPMRHGRWYPDRKLRLVRPERARWVGDDPHDRLEVDGPVVALSAELHHEPYRTIWEHLSTIDRYTAIHARALRGRGVRARPWDPWVRPALHFVDALLLKSAWRDGPEGVAVAALGAAHTHLKWARLRALGGGG